MLTNITKDKLPFYFVESQTIRDEWVRFTYEPFATKEKASQHIDKIVDELCASRDRLRIREYTARDWRNDLIDEIMKDEDAIQRALSILRTEVLVEIMS